MHPPIDLGRRFFLRSPLTRALGAGFCVFFSYLPVSAHAVEQGSIELGAGLHVPFDNEERDVYQSGPDLCVGYTSRISTDGRARVRFEIAWLQGSGEEIVPDPTFEVVDARYDLLQVGVGLRQNAVTDPEIGTAFWLGAGVLNVFSWWRDPLGERDFADVMGFYLELMPEIPVGEHWNLWVRVRLQIVADADYGRFAPLDYNSSMLDVGVSYAWF